MTVLPDTSVVLCTRERPALVADSIEDRKSVV